MDDSQTLPLYEKTKKAFLADERNPHGRPASSSSDRIRLQRTCRQHIIAIGIFHQVWITRGVHSRFPSPD